MKLLVTAGNTEVFLDRVRCLTNIFTGRTGAAIALEAYRRGHEVSLLTSRPDAISVHNQPETLSKERWQLTRYRTLDELCQLMEQELRGTAFDAVVHSAAVSDYVVGGVFAPARGTSFLEGQNSWHAETGKLPALIDRSAGKIKSGEPELWLRLLRAPKLVDMIRPRWGFQGTLVKFKLEVGVSDEQLLDSAEKSRSHSQADLMVANTLEGASAWAYLGPFDGKYVRVVRPELAAKLMDALENARR